MIDCVECNSYATLILDRGEIKPSEFEKLALDRHILKGCEKQISNDVHVIKIAATSDEFRKGFMSAMRCVQDMGKGAHTFHSLLNVIDSIIYLHEKGSFFQSLPKEILCHVEHGNN